MLLMKAYSIDLRKRVLDAYDSGKCSLNQIAEQFQVTTRWIQKLRRQREQEGSIAPRPQNQGRKPAFRGAHLEQLNTFVLETATGSKTVKIQMPETKAVNAIELELQSFARAIINGSAPEVSLDDARAALILAHDISSCIEKNLQEYQL